MITIVPAAGFGTRLLPGSKSIPKEMFPIVNTPAIEYIANEVRIAGLKDILIITAKNKDSIIDYFDTNHELEVSLKSKGKFDVIENITRNNNLNIVTVRQKEQKGLGHAVLMGKNIVGSMPFIVSLPDMLVVNGGHHLSEMLKIWKNTGKGVIALMEVPKDKVDRYGIIDGKIEDGYLIIHDMLEKPNIEDAPTNLAILGRYILPNKTMEFIENTQPGAIGEIQLTDALKQIAKKDGIIGYIVNDEVHDTGNPLGFLKANISFGLRDPALKKELEEFIKRKIDL